MKRIEELYMKNKQDIYRYLVSITHDPALSEDLLSETFVNAIKSVGKFKGKSDIKTWMFSIARYTWYSHLRKSKSDVSFDELVDIYLEENIEDEVVKRESADRIRAILNLENERSKKIVLMRIDGYSYYEIAKECNISEGSARVIDFRMKKKIRDMLEKEELVNGQNIM